MKLKKAFKVKIIITFAIGLILSTFLAKGYGVNKLLQSIGVKYQISFQVQKTEISEAIISEKHQGKLQLFVLAGQSNMSGMGALLWERLLVYSTFKEKLML
jgi:hypothetical protein